MCGFGVSRRRHAAQDILWICAMWFGTKVVQEVAKTSACRLSSVSATSTRVTSSGPRVMERIASFTNTTTLGRQGRFVRGWLVSARVARGMLEHRAIPVQLVSLD